MKQYNDHFVRRTPDGTLEFGPIPLKVEIPRHDEGIDDETGEPYSRDWIERRTVLFPTAEDYAIMGYLPYTPTPPPRRFSKLKLYAALAQANLWDPLGAWLNTQTFEGINAYTAFMLAQDLVEDHPMFAQWLAAAKTALSITDEQAETILAAAAEEE